MNQTIEKPPFIARELEEKAREDRGRLSRELVELTREVACLECLKR